MTSIQSTQQHAVRLLDAWGQAHFDKRETQKLQPCRHTGSDAGRGHDEVSTWEAGRLRQATP